MKVLVTQSCPALRDTVDCSPPGSPVHGTLWGRILEWVDIPFSRGPSWPRDQTQVSCIAGRFFTIWATRETVILTVINLWTVCFFLRLLLPSPICLQSVQSLSRVQLFATPWTAAGQASLSIANSQSLLKLVSIELVMPSNHLFLCLPLLLPPSIFPSIRVFSSESVLRIRWPKYGSFSFSISPSCEHSGLVFFSLDCLDLLAVSVP